MISMRAKMMVDSVVPNADNTSETLKFRAVSKSGSYPEDGADENNTFAMWTPTANLEMQINNPALLGKHAVGEAYYVDFTKAD